MFATIQVASQFNNLEMVNWEIVPEDGITDYETDKTQGPACCLCTGPAVVYRNYLYGGGHNASGQPHFQMNNLFDFQSFLNKFKDEAFKSSYDMMQKIYNA